MNDDLSNLTPEEIDELAKSARREYQREYQKQYRATHKEEIKRNKHNYWARKALAKKAQEEALK